ncbi:hypothetical protein LCGC14_0799370 [marine sediment metagenome]|uniref:Uncharacterized protein n=1 Tax=marine sediment metagenome TaxID=412755 RepID=A0A0F9Q9Y5_9ZZZZ
MRDASAINEGLHDIEKAVSTIRAEVARYIEGREVAHTALNDAVGILQAKVNMISGLLPVLEVGDTVKVYLKGESPWAKVTHILDSDNIQAKVINVLVNTHVHGVTRNDEELFILAPARQASGNRIWEHAPCITNHHGVG